MSPTRQTAPWTVLLVFALAALAPSCSKPTPPRPAPLTSPRTPTAPPATTPVPDAGSAPAPTRTLELNFVYGSEKKAWIEAAVARFEAAPDSTLPGFHVQVKALAVGSGSAFQDIVDGVVQAHVWSPASDVFRPLLNRAWTAKNGAIGGEREVAPPGKPLVLTPVVIAMWRPMAEALGWPNAALGWSDVLALATDARGWAGKGHGEWGLFKLGHTHPEYSNSGLLSVLAELYAANGKTTGLSEADIMSPATLDYVRKIEQSIVHYGKSTGFFADRMLKLGPAAMSAAVLYENLVIDSYRRPEYAARAMDLVAIYPKEGTFWCDNPFITLNAPWVSDEHRAAAQAFERFLASEPMQRLAMSEYGFRPADPSIGIGDPISASYGVDAKQPQTLLQTPDADHLDQALAAWRLAKKTVDIIFVFDRSGSMNGEPMRQAKQGAKDFIAALDDRDRVAVLYFNDKVGDVPPLAEVGKTRDALLRSLDGVFADGGTSLRDAIAAAHKALSKRAAKEPERVHAVVVMSDGQDTDSLMAAGALDTALTPAAEANTAVRVFTIAYGSEADKAILAGIAERAQGAAFVGTTATIRTIYQDLAAFF